MRIALCSPMSVSYYGGAEKQICETAELLHRSGHEVEVYALPFAYTGRKIKVEEVLSLPYKEAWRHKIAADVTYVYYQPLYWRMFSISGPKVASLHSIEIFRPVPLTSRKYWLFRIIGYQDLASFDAVRVLNPMLNIKHRNTRYVPEWIDTSFFKPVRPKPEKFTVLFVGRKTSWKGWPIFKEMCSRLNRDGFDFSFKCTGQGNSLIRGLGFIKNDMPKVYSRAHVVVHPSIADTFGLVIAEALSCGTPVVTTPIPEHVSLLLPLYYAWRVNDFVERVKYIYYNWKSDVRWYEKLSSSCRRGVMKYDVGNVFPKLERLLAGVAMKGKLEAES